MSSELTLPHDNAFDPPSEPRDTPVPGREARIEARGIHKRFVGQTGRPFVALEGVDLALQDGELVSLIGPSGCGKSTLLEILAGLQAPTEGTVTVDGAPVTGPGPDRAVVFQNYALFPWRTVIDNVAFSMEIDGVGRTERHGRARAYLELMGLLGFENHHTWQLSGGMRQRVGLARALACEPQVLLMDEPFGALDAITRDVLQDHLLRIQAETRKSIVFVTHSVDEAIYLSDRIIAMGTTPGRIVREFSVDLERGYGREHMRSLPEYNVIHAAIWEVLSAEMAKPLASAGEGP